MPGGLIAWQRQLQAFRGSLQTMLAQVDALIDSLPDTNWDARVDAPAPSATSRSRSPRQSHGNSTSNLFRGRLAVQQAAGCATSGEAGGWAAPAWLQLQGHVSSDLFPRG